MYFQKLHFRFAPSEQHFYTISLSKKTFLKLLSQKTLIYSSSESSESSEKLSKS